MEKKIENQNTDTDQSKGISIQRRMIVGLVLMAILYLIGFTLVGLLPPIDPRIWWALMGSMFGMTFTSIVLLT